MVNKLIHLNENKIREIIRKYEKEILVALAQTTKKILRSISPLEIEPIEKFFDSTVYAIKNETYKIVEAKVIRIPSQQISVDKVNLKDYEIKLRLPTDNNTLIVTIRIPREEFGTLLIRTTIEKLKNNAKEIIQLLNASDKIIYICELTLTKLRRYYNIDQSQRLLLTSIYYREIAESTRLKNILRARKNIYVDFNSRYNEKISVEDAVTNTIYLIVTIKPSILIMEKKILDKIVDKIAKMIAETIEKILKEQFVLYDIT